MRVLSISKVDQKIIALLHEIYFIAKEVLLLLCVFERNWNVIYNYVFGEYQSHGKLLALQLLEEAKSLQLLELSLLLN